MKAHILIGDTNTPGAGTATLYRDGDSLVLGLALTNDAAVAIEVSSQAEAFNIAVSLLIAVKDFDSKGFSLLTSSVARDNDSPFSPN